MLKLSLVVRVVPRSDFHGVLEARGVGGAVLCSAFARSSCLLMSAKDDDGVVGALRMPPVSLRMEVGVTTSIGLP